MNQIYDFSHEDSWLMTLLPLYWAVHQLFSTSLLTKDKPHFLGRPRQTQKVESSPSPVRASVKQNKQQWTL